ncbi:hypothetical protein BKA70DRAFT_1214081 [Coprinopsis sp. MPI-PUGE-AT-0042]|nr:hypothetical protein BKA70DRAFT_1214081 [Coprinopsis sp. MPI-PUGE-AT-0042]
MKAIDRTSEKINLLKEGFQGCKISRHDGIVLGWQRRRNGWEAIRRLQWVFFGSDSSTQDRYGQRSPGTALVEAKFVWSARRSERKPEAPPVAATTLGFSLNSPSAFEQHVDGIKYTKGRQEGSGFNKPGLFGSTAMVWGVLALTGGAILAMKYFQFKRAFEEVFNHPRARI